MFSFKMSWDNRTRPVRLDAKTGRSWTRRLHWLEDAEGRVKLKLWDGAAYREVLADEPSARTIWDRFKAGQSIDDAVSILGREPPQFLKSRKAADAPDPD